MLAISTQQEQQIILKFLVAEDTPGQKFIVFCLHCLRVKLYHIQACLSRAHFHSRRQSVSSGDLACEQHSANSDKTLTLRSDWQTCNRSYEIAAELSLDIGSVESSENFEVPAWQKTIRSAAEGCR